MLPFRLPGSCPADADISVEGELCHPLDILLPMGFIIGDGRESRPGGNLAPGKVGHASFTGIVFPFHSPLGHSRLGRGIGMRLEAAVNIKDAKSFYHIGLAAGITQGDRTAQRESADIGFTYTKVCQQVMQVFDQDIQGVILLPGRRR